jgi:RHS repeat-associated protein
MGPKAVPPAKTDARGIVTTMTYDAQNRLTEKSYSDGTTPAVVFGYDITNVSGTTIQYPIGRLVLAEVLSSSPNYIVHAAYDTMGRVTSDWRRMPAQALLGITNPYVVNTNYNTGGEVINDSNEFFSITPSYDPVGRVEQIASSLSDANHPATLLSINPVTGYTAAEDLAQMTYGNGLVETVTYNNRLQPTSLLTYNPTTNANILNLSYGYTNSAGANNGNVTSLISTATQIFMRSYTYDSLNRLWTMSSPADASGCYGLAWTYDHYGNRLTQSATGGSVTCPQPSYGVLTNNRLTNPGYSYDAAGNMTGDGIHTYSYDAESRLIQVDGTAGNCSTATACYVYDAEGLRLQKTKGSTTTVYLRNSKGEVVAETDGGNTLLRAGYVYAAGSLLAEYENGTTYFVHKDHLGDTRVMTAANGSICDSMDYLPYGEQIAGGSCSTHKFTGKERDAESGLDDFDARYYSSSLGRFVSADWSATPVPVPYADFKDPQSLNLYSYVRNLPTVRMDPNGHDDHPGAWGLVRDWLDVIEVSGSYGESASVGWQVGKAVEVKLQVGTEVEGTIGAGGGNGKVETFTGGKAVAKAGSVGGEVKVGVSTSTKDGVSASAKAEASAGSKTASATVDKNGVHTDVGAKKDQDSKLGGHVTLGVGVGVAINTSQAGRAYDRTAQSAQAATGWLSRQYDKLKQAIGGGAPANAPQQ